jgi:23S rRNA (cytidine1920-2'-O)/16S rRNA (cytidine1409-2'-O)-methyltransferase
LTGTGPSDSLTGVSISQFAEKVLNCHCEERFLRRGNLEVLDILDYEFASLRSQRQQKDLFSGLLCNTNTPMPGKSIDKSVKLRLDRLLVERGLVESRERGQAIIIAGQVLVNGQKVEKSGSLVLADADIRVLGHQMPYVSRGGLKLDKALAEFTIDLREKTCLDVGASTGGFTDCLLQHGAKKVYSVDVGYGQMAWKIRQDPRVVVIERTNIREMDAALIPEKIDIVVIDVSFISLEKVIPAVLRFLNPGAGIIALIKPQFEVGKEQVGKGGIVRDEAAREASKDRIVAFVAERGFEVKGVIRSPITGQDGNVEYLMHALLR